MTAFNKDNLKRFNLLGNCEIKWRVGLKPVLIDNEILVLADKYNVYFANESFEELGQDYSEKGLRSSKVEEKQIVKRYESLEEFMKDFSKK